MKLSMVTVCFNAEKSIERTMKSVFSQTAPIYEYLIIDGGSSDSTMSIVNSYREKFESRGIKFVTVSEPDNGISDAFNKGIRLATGDLIGLINADDEMLPQTCSILSNSFEEGIDIYYGNCIWDEITNNLRFVSKPKETNPEKLDRLMYEMVMIHPATFITKKAYEKCGYYDISFRYCMDEELLYRMFKNGIKFRYIDREFSVFMAGGVSDSNPKKVFDEVSRIPLMYGEPKFKVELIEIKKLTRDFFARKAKSLGLYKVLKKRAN